MKAEKLEYRMMGLVPYNLSPIQQGIQYAHAVVEYMKGWQGAHLDKWAEKDKTMIILNGGTTNLGDRGSFGSLNSHQDLLNNNKIEFSSFYEPDLGDQLTAVVFLADERVWNKEKYPDFYGSNGLISRVENQRGYKDWLELIGGEQNVWLREFLKQFRLA